MPKTDPISAERLEESICVSVMTGHVSHTALIAEIEKRDAQRDRAALEQAAERVCKECECEKECIHIGERCDKYMAILSPIADEKEGA